MIPRILAPALAVLLTLSGCPGPHREERVAAIDFLWVSQPHGEFRGGLSHAEIHVAPSDDPGLQVGIFETKAAGTGPSWRATIWQAVLLGSFLAGRFPTDHRYWVETETLSEKVDGPSAGALFTVGVVAALRGDAVRPDATLTGTINPDGSVGPVDGVVQKFDAALKAGKRRLGYPAGQRYTKDLTTGKQVDLELLAMERGATAVEVPDLQAGYEVITGRRLPRRTPLPPDDLVLGDAARSLFEAKAETWRLVTRELRKARSQGGGTPSPEAAALWEEADRACLGSEDLSRRGLAAAAYSEAVQAFTYVSIVDALEPFRAALASGDWKTALDHVEAQVRAADGEMKDLLDRLEDLPLGSPGQVVQALDAFEALLHAFGSLQVAGGGQSGLLERLAQAGASGNPQQLAEELAREATGRLTEIEIARVYLRVARDYAALVDLEEGGRRLALDSRGFEEVQGIYEAAAEANLEYFDTLYVGTLADHAKLNPEVVRKELLDTERTYRTAFFNLKFPKTLFEGLAPSGTRTHTLARLSGALSSYFASSALITRYVVLEVRKENGELKGLRRQKGLDTMLGLAEEGARAHAAAALERLGAIPLSARIEYELGVWRRGREDLGERLDALSHFWRASKWCQLAITLDRHAASARGRR